MVSRVYELETNFHFQMLMVNKWKSCATPTTEWNFKFFYAFVSNVQKKVSSFQTRYNRILLPVKERKIKSRGLLALPSHQKALQALTQCFRDPSAHITLLSITLTAPLAIRRASALPLPINQRSSLLLPLLLLD